MATLQHYRSKQDVVTMIRERKFYFHPPLIERDEKELMDVASIIARKYDLENLYIYKNKPGFPPMARISPLPRHDPRFLGSHEYLPEGSLCGDTFSHEPTKIGRYICYLSDSFKGLPKVKLWTGTESSFSSSTEESDG